MGNSNGKPIVLTDEVNLNHFRLLRVVGKGAFGKVRIVERKDSGLTFALKYIRKDEVVRSESVRNIIRERRMLEHLNHPFLCNLRYSFQDMEYLYIVVDLMNGGDLRFHITRLTLTEEAVRFWIAELGCALRYIHQQNIVHRDVKPDNVLLDSQGHVHLADFNVASDLTPGKQLTSRSGTLAYLAPEVYEGRGYASEVDWWSLGVLFYECIYNKRPFDAGGQYEALAASIVKADPPFPVTSPPVSMPCLHAISSLLEKDKTRRIGAAGWESFTDNPFFREIDFEALERKEIEPIFCPSGEKPNFDATYDLEELLLEEAPLEARARKQKPRPELRTDATPQEVRADELHKMIESMFEPFNYTQAPEDRSPISMNGAHTNASPKQYARSEKETYRNSRPRPPKSQAIPTSRSQTPGSGSRTRTSAHSPDGSPPLPATALTANFAIPATSPPQSEYFPPPLPTSDSASTIRPPPQSQQSHHQPQPHQDHTRLTKTRTIRYEDVAAHAPPIPVTTTTTTATNTTSSSSRSAHHRPRGSTRSTSMGGGVQVVLNEQGSWSEMAHASQGLVTPGTEEVGGRGGGGGGGGGGDSKPSGMLGFLGRKKGRDRSPKAGKVRERGVLGKEGARVVVGHG
ncbi:Serine/threonine kinase [Friedmanniomyces endolithicus]|uniref:Serine/threonine kinase n=1 Tax=Friedmanniomyces endolithicus TaxID=329885 RepID=A0AAN6FIN7_9PEZI|nr:Serine/threonine kinase [Friedmanniomyces endolithicus]KAK0288383.1 Serine/threonine kinase [Friedmanniomyces endolithicus]KAK0307965.1 Serine/threonine kinase [Friedmanniomyces endolithicus]KAK0317894.1 Serine/threonine kinase [Friedmanniomyces endolithicus]KAK0831680.1 Serine/threonine kinase [Friedmanniomyces endolithicus]